MPSEPSAFGASEAVIQAAARGGSSCSGELRGLAGVLVGLKTEDDAPDGLSGCRSRLNNDGTPLQLCLSADAGKCRVRLIGDPAAWREDAASRYRATERTLVTLLSERDSAALEPVCRDLLHTAVPRDGAALSAFKNGVAWLGAAPEGAGVAVYVEAAAQAPDAAWRTAANWVRRCLKAPATALSIIETLSPQATLASYGLEGRRPEDARAKLYFRLDPPRPLHDIGVDLLADPAVVEFLIQAVGEFGVDADGIVLCLGFSVATGNLVDAKIDLCGHCLAYPPEVWARVADRLCSTFDLAPIPTRSVLAPGDCEVAFLGFGIRQDGGRRLNLYVKPANACSPYHSAIARGVAYLRAMQQPDGGWRDFNLPVGAADQWVTAYAGLALAEVSDCGLSPEAAAEAGRAADWLVAERAYAAGWGYNAITGADADSTAFAVALLDRLGRPVAPADRRFLRDLWRRDGGIATYERPDAWGQAHPCVTPLAFLGLSESDRRTLKPDVLAYLDDCRLPDGLWPAYWWRRPYYATLCVLDLLNALGDVERRADALPALDWRSESDAFNRACIAAIEQARGAPDNRLWAVAATLLNLQEDDGRWPGSANLRVTAETCWRPWERPEGQLFVDEAGILTTATVIRVLVRLLHGKPIPHVAGKDAASGADAEAAGADRWTGLPSRRAVHHG